MALQSTAYELMHGSFKNRPMKSRMVEYFVGPLPNIAESDSDLGAFKAHATNGSGGAYAMTDSGLRCRSGTGSNINKLDAHYNRMFNPHGCVYESVAQLTYDLSINQGMGDDPVNDMPQHCYCMAGYSGWQSDDMANHIEFQTQSATAPARGYTKVATGIRSSLNPFHTKIEMLGFGQTLSINGVLGAEISQFNQSVSSYNYPHVMRTNGVYPMIEFKHSYTPPTTARDGYVSYIEAYNV